MEKAAKAKKTSKPGQNRTGQRNAEKPLGKAAKITEKPEDNAGIIFPDKCDCFIGMCIHSGKKDEWIRKIPLQVLLELKRDFPCSR